MSIIIKRHMLLILSLFLIAMTCACSEPKPEQTGSDKKLDPNDALAYTLSGAEKANSGNFDGAIADFNLAIEANPQISGVYRYRGIAKVNTGDFDGAILDFNKAIELEPSFANTYENRGVARRIKGDLDGAIADESKSIELKPTLIPAYCNRGNAEYVKGDYAAAATDYSKYIEMAATKAQYGLGPPDAADNARFFLLLTLRRLHRDETPAGLAPAMAGWKDGWNKTVGNYLAGKLSETDFLAQASNNDPKISLQQRCQAYYYAGMTHLLRGDLPVAQDLFRTSVATHRIQFVEYDFARAELARLGDTR